MRNHDPSFVAWLAFFAVFILLGWLFARGVLPAEFTEGQAAVYGDTTETTLMNHAHGLMLGAFLGGLGLGLGIAVVVMLLGVREAMRAKLAAESKSYIGKGIPRADCGNREPKEVTRLDLVILRRR